MPRKLPPPTAPPRSLPSPTQDWIALSPTTAPELPDYGRIPTIAPPGAHRIAPVLEEMKRSGMKIDRENYIWMEYGAEPPDWGPELEAELPPELQDWSRFEKD
jgi:hypothetical protein